MERYQFCLEHLFHARAPDVKMSSFIIFPASNLTITSFSSCGPHIVDYRISAAYITLKAKCTQHITHALLWCQVRHSDCVGSWVGMYI